MNNYCCVLQEDKYDCGIASLATIFSYFKYNYTLEYLKQLMSYNPNTLTNFFQLHSLSDRLGFSSTGYMLDSLDLFTEVELPCIAQLSFCEDIFHFVVIFEISKDGLLIADPSVGLKTVTLNTFVRNFTGNILVIAPKKISKIYFLD